MLVALLVMILLLGHKVSAFWLGLPLFLILYIGLLVLLILVILVFDFLFEQWAGHRLLSEKVTRPHVRANRAILIPSVPVSEGIEIRHGCQFLSSLVRALAKLPGGLGWFVPCHLGSHLFSSRPLESCHHQCLKAVCGVLGYPSGAAAALLDGTLKLPY